MRDKSTAIELDDQIFRNESCEVLADRPKSAGEKPGGWFHIK